MNAGIANADARRNCHGIPGFFCREIFRMFRDFSRGFFPGIFPGDFFQDNFPKKIPDPEKIPVVSFRVFPGRTGIPPGVPPDR